MRGIFCQYLQIKLKLHLLLFYPSTWYICVFFLFHIEIEGKGGWVIGGGCREYVAPPPPPLKLFPRLCKRCSISHKHCTATSAEKKRGALAVGGCRGYVAPPLSNYFHAYANDAQSLTSTVLPLRLKKTRSSCSAKTTHNLKAKNITAVDFLSTVRLNNAGLTTSLS